MADIRFATKTYEKRNDDELYELRCRMYYQLKHMQVESPHWMHTVMMQYPSELISYQEILWIVKPQLVIETGTAGGGCTFFFATILDMMITLGRIEDYEVVSIDINNPPDIQHPKITFTKGDTESAEIIEEVKRHWSLEKATMVFLDSAHDKRHVLAEMEAYGPLVSVGSYMVVEDTVFGYLQPDDNAALAAVEQWMSTHDGWEIDRWPERWLITHHPCGWLKRVR